MTERRDVPWGLRAVPDLGCWELARSRDELAGADRVGPSRSSATSRGGSVERRAAVVQSGADGSAGEGGPGSGTGENGAESLPDAALWSDGAASSEQRTTTRQGERGHRAILGVLGEPRQVFACLQASGEAVRVAYGSYAAADRFGNEAAATGSRPRRQQPIRDAIMAFLSEPRSARAIADRIGRPVPTATGHLGAMQRCGLVRRLGFAAYARADYTGPPLEFRPPPRMSPVQLAIAAFLAEPRSRQAIADRFGLSANAIQGHLAALRARGEAVRIACRTWVSASHPAASGPISSARPRPVFDRTVAFLTEPRSVAEMAAHLGRPARSVGHHLAKLARLGLIGRLEPGVYVRADCAGPAANSGARCPRGALTAALLEVLGEPRSTGVIARRVEMPYQKVRSRLSWLARHGEVIRLRKATYVRADVTFDPSARAVTAATESSREAIMSFLDRPRLLDDIVAHVGGPKSTLSHRLAAMTNLGLIRRVGQASYARADYAGPNVAVRRRRRARAELDPLSMDILRFLDEPRAWGAVVRHVPQSQSTTRRRLAMLCARGAVIRLRGGVYVRAERVAPALPAVGAGSAGEMSKACVGFEERRCSSAGPPHLSSSALQG